MVPGALIVQNHRHCDRRRWPWLAWCAAKLRGLHAYWIPNQDLRILKIRRIFAHRVELPLAEGSYNWSGGKSVSVFDSTIVGVETACGLVGYGEVCPLGPFYLPAYAEGVRAGLKELGPHLIGMDPRGLGQLNERMDAALKGHPYVKSGIDIACWDLLGQATGLPVCLLMGGRFGESVTLYRAISQVPPDEMAANVASYSEQG